MAILSSKFSTKRFQLVSKHANYSSWNGQQNVLQIMSEEHKITKKDKLVLTITLAAIFFGVFVLGLVGLIVNLSS